MSAARDLMVRSLAAGAGIALVLSSFLPWTAEGRVPLDIGLLAFDGTAQPTVALTLVFLGALPAVAALTGARGWPRLVAGAGGGGLVVAWLAAGPQAALAAGVWVALGACVVLFFTAAASPAPDRSSRPEVGRSDPHTVDL